MTTPALVSVRFLLALWVVVYHVTKTLIGDDPLGHAISAGPCAVTFFFVLSGFVLTLRYGARLSLAQYARARFARLAPLYWLSLLLVLPIGLAARTAGLVEDAHPARTLALVFFAVQAWTVDDALRWNPALWSISVEVFAYALLPLLLMASRAWSRTAALVACSACAIAALAPAALFPYEVARFFPPVRALDFASGVLLARAYLAGARVPTWTAAIATCLLFAVLASGALAPVYVDGGAASAVACLIVLALAPVTKGPLVSALAVKLGDASYALYALHLPVFFWALALTRTKPDAVTLPLAGGVVLASLAAAWIAHAAVERPLRSAIAARSR